MLVEKNESEPVIQDVKTTVIHGKVARKIFYNAENGYCVLSIAIPEDAITPEWGGKEIKVTGHMMSVRPDDEYRFTGEWVEHPRFGKQFKFTKSELLLPTGKSGAAKYLSTITLGVGIAKGKKIVDLVGDDALDKIKNNPMILKAPEFSFLTEAQRNDITTDLLQNSVQAELAGMIIRDGIGMGTVGRIMAEYGDRAVAIVKENPYILTNLYGVGFVTADAIAQSVGVAPDSPFRVEAAIDYTVRESGNEGHVYLRPSDVVQRLIGRKGLIEASGVSIDEIAIANKKIIDDGRCIREDDSIYSSKLYKAEKQLGMRIRGLALSGKKKVTNLNQKISAMEQKLDIEYAKEQKEAIERALTNPISVITGGPGTGKSEITRAIVEIYHNSNIVNSIYLCAPTGRAAQRLGEATGKEGKTIHRLLRYNPGTGAFEHGYANPLPGPGLLIADEFSMADIELANDLIAAVSTDMQTVIIGDIDQLPSVGPGSVLRDIISSGMVPTTRLKFNYRQAKGSRIAQLANTICVGGMPLLENDGDFEFIEVQNGEEAASKVLDLVAEIKAKYSPLDWTVLSPMRRGSAGVNELNKKIREMVNPSIKDKPTLGWYRAGDKVMVIKNNYHLNVFNGEIGIVSNLDPERGEMNVNFGSYSVTFASTDLDLLTLAYASTIHKSQGSEFPVVIMPLVQQHYIMLQRNLLYTGMTRAREKLILVAEKRSVRRAVKNNVIEKRFSFLAERIRGETW